LFADLAQQDFDWCHAWFVRKRVEKPLQQLVGRAGLCREYQWTLRIRSSPRTARSGSDRVEGRSGLSEHHLAGAGERYSATVPFEELDAKSLLQLADGTGEGRLCDPESIGGAAEMQFFGDGDEVPELAGLEIVHRRSLRL
jgi:hypothetical protein